MAKAKESAQWDHTSALMACVATLFGSRPVHPDEVNPLKMGQKSFGVRELVRELGGQRSKHPSR